MDSVAFWLNPALVVGIGTLLWRFLIKKFDRIDAQFRELTREVVANGKSTARIEGRHEGHTGLIGHPPETSTLVPRDR